MIEEQAIEPQATKPPGPWRLPTINSHADLEWKKDAGEVGEKTWPNAIDYVEGLNKKEVV
ncbi:MAG: hypothetical protein HQL05_03795 [Nitrospirae bacterium]|uniref:hypothetical protein n=1 Tax=Candidatus Magnetobacterium casense TaxID=1455061 RepID=UPI00059042D9|nr:hypothetical protein [Candidatus Magnetobacterium casensis]MBF0336932.1 hypothetical protein [Nitrospirota bacterium]